MWRKLKELLWQNWIWQSRLSNLAGLSLVDDLRGDSKVRISWRGRTLSTFRRFRYGQFSDNLVDGTLWGQLIVNAVGSFSIRLVGGINLRGVLERLYAEVVDIVWWCYLVWRFPGVCLKALVGLNNEQNIIVDLNNLTLVTKMVVMWEKDDKKSVSRAKKDVCSILCLVSCILYVKCRQSVMFVFVLSSVCLSCSTLTCWWPTTNI